MAHRSYAFLTGSLVILAGTCSERIHLVALREGVTLPPSHLLADSAGATVLTWVFDADDCLACVTPAAALRRIVARQRATMRLRLLAVASDSAVVAGFLRQERLRAEVVRLSESRARAVLGPLTRPALLLTRGRTLVKMWVGVKAIEGATAGENPRIVRWVERAAGIPAAKTTERAVPGQDGGIP
jgi:glutathione S-transferase